MQEFIWNVHQSVVKCKEIRQSEERQQIICEFESQLSAVGVLSSGKHWKMEPKTCSHLTKEGIMGICILSPVRLG